MSIFEKVFGKNRPLNSSAFAKQVKAALSKGIPVVSARPFAEHRYVKCKNCGTVSECFTCIDMEPTPTGGTGSLACPSCSTVWLKVC